MFRIQAQDRQMLIRNYIGIVEKEKLIFAIIECTCCRGDVTAKNPAGTNILEKDSARIMKNKQKIFGIS